MGDYQGYPNYETWSVALLLGGSMGREEYEAGQKVVRGALGRVMGHPSYNAGIWTLEETRLFTLADALKEWIEDMLFEGADAPEGLGSQLMRAGFDEVDWEHLAQGILDEQREEAKTT